MVREANVKQANAEKQLKEALGKVTTPETARSRILLRPMHLSSLNLPSFFRSTSSRQKSRP